MFAVAVAVAMLVTAVFCLTDGGIRLALQFALAKRIGGVFTPEVIVAGDSLAASCPFKGSNRRPFAVLNLAAGGATIMEIAGQIHRARDIPARWLLIDGGLNDLLFDNAAPDQLDADFRALFRRMEERRRVIVTLMPYGRSGAVGAHRGCERQAGAALRGARLSCDRSQSLDLAGRGAGIGHDLRRAAFLAQSGRDMARRGSWKDRKRTRRRLRRRLEPQER